MGGTPEMFFYSVEIAFIEYRACDSMERDLYFFFPYCFFCSKFWGDVALFMSGEVCGGGPPSHD